MQKQDFVNLPLSRMCPLLRISLLFLSECVYIDACVSVFTEARARAWKCLCFVDLRRSFAHALQVFMCAFTFLHICTSQYAALAMTAMSPRTHRMSCAITHVKTWGNRFAQRPSLWTWTLNHSILWLCFFPVSPLGCVWFDRQLESPFRTSSRRESRMVRETIIKEITEYERRGFHYAAPTF